MPPTAPSDPRQTLDDLEFLRHQLDELIKRLRLLEEKDATIDAYPHIWATTSRWSLHNTAPRVAA